MRVLVTGNLGYVGSIVAPFLVTMGHEVHGLDTGFYEDCHLYPSLDPPTLKIDVRDVVPADLEGFDAVVHLAALSNDPLGELDPALTEDINLGGTLRVALAAQAAGVKRMVFASSCSLYGKGGADAVDESAPQRPQTAYARSKVKAEAALREMASDAFCPVLLRFATAHGVSPRLRLDLVVNNLVGWAVTAGVIKIMSDGSPWRPLIHVQDMARAIACALVAPQKKVCGQAFNTGRPTANYTVADIATRVSQQTDCSVTVNAAASPDTRSYKVFFNKIRKFMPDFQPEWDLDHGITQLVRAYRDYGMDGEKFAGPEFTRLLELKRLLAEGTLRPDLRWAL